MIFKSFLNAACACLIVASISGCSTQGQIIDHDIVLFKGDNEPVVQSSAAIAGDMTNLSEGETLIVAVAGDGSGALSQPTMAEVKIQETILSSDNFDLDLIMSRCDPDGDGILDVYCPDLINSMNNGMLQNEKFVSFQSWYLITKDLDTDEDVWGSNVTIDRAKVTEQEVPVYLKLITINRGNIAFKGDLTIYGNAPPQMKIKKITEYSKIKDQTGTKATMDSIPIVSWFSNALDNYSVIETSANFKVEKADDGHAKLTIKNINVEPGEGVTLEFTAVYTVTDK